MNLKSKLQEWQSCDSISLKERLKDEIEALIVPILKKEKTICDENGVESLWGHCAYHHHKAGNYNLVGYSNTRVDFEYEDSWAWEGYCKFTFSIPIEEIENFNEDELRLRILHVQAKALEDKIYHAKTQVSELEKQLRIVNAVIKIKKTT